MIMQDSSVIITELFKCFYLILSLYTDICSLYKENTALNYKKKKKIKYRALQKKWEKIFEQKLKSLKT